LDITQELRDTENALRDFIASVLQRDLGHRWIDQTGVSDERVARWRERKEVETKRQETGVVDERLLYYADFYDLRTILKKHWQRFASALGEWKVLDVYLGELEALRDPDAHRRELLPHQKHLILGIGGEIRTRLVRYRSKQETAEDYFPCLESARDSLGNLWVPGDLLARMRMVSAKQTLRPGDTLDFVATASDPFGEQLEYAATADNSVSDVWQRDGTFRVRITDRNIGTYFSVSLKVRSLRSSHAAGSHDDAVQFVYTVLPAKP